MDCGPRTNGIYDRGLIEDRGRKADEQGCG